MEVNHFGEVPDPIFNEILDYLNAKELAKISNVSKRWKKFALADSFWKKDSIRGMHESFVL